MVGCLIAYLSDELSWICLPEFAVSGCKCEDWKDRVVED